MRRHQARARHGHKFACHTTYAVMMVFGREHFTVLAVAVYGFEECVLCQVHPKAGFPSQIGREVYQNVVVSVSRSIQIKISPDLACYFASCYMYFTLNLILAVFHNKIRTPPIILHLYALLLF